MIKLEKAKPFAIHYRIVPHEIDKFGHQEYLMMFKVFDENGNDYGEVGDMGSTIDLIIRYEDEAEEWYIAYLSMDNPAIDLFNQAARKILDAISELDPTGLVELIYLAENKIGAEKDSRIFSYRHSFDE